MPATGEHDVLRWLNTRDGEAWRLWLGTTDHLAYPALYGTVPALWVARLAEGDRAYADAWRASLAWVSSAAAVKAVKLLVRRERPFRVVNGIERRDGYPGGRSFDTWSFPSGHAMISAALAASFALSHPEWYVILPAAALSVSIGWSRVWLGVHYPGDVVAGWLLGSAVAWGVDRLGDTEIPPGLRGRSDAPVLRVALAW